MKVIFIGTTLEQGEGPDLVEFDIYTVVKEHGQYYELTIADQWGYHKSGFIPLSEIDETQMARNYKTQLT